MHRSSARGPPFEPGNDGGEPELERALEIPGLVRSDRFVNMFEASAPKPPLRSAAAGSSAGNGPGPNCPVTKAVRTLDGKWKLHLIYQLMDGTKRFSELQRAVPNITQQMLAAQLRQLEADGIVSHVVYPQVPPKVEYSLTTLGRQLQGVTDALAAWGANLPSAAS